MKMRMLAALSLAALCLVSRPGAAQSVGGAQAGGAQAGGAQAGGAQAGGAQAGAAQAGAAQAAAAQSTGGPAANPSSAPPPASPDSPPPPANFLQRAQQTIVSGEELHRWDRYVRGFRREHNFALSTGVSSGTWDVRRFGSLTKNGPQKYDTTGVFTRFQYSFHLPFYSGFGFFLGSSIGYHYESADKRKPFKPVPAYQFPGVLSGLVLNFNPVLRWSIGLDAYLERHNGIQERDQTPPDNEIFVTMQVYDFGTFSTFSTI